MAQPRSRQPCQRTKAGETRSKSASWAPSPLLRSGSCLDSGTPSGRQWLLSDTPQAEGSTPEQAPPQPGAPSSPPLRGVAPTHSGAWCLGSLPSSWWEPPGHAGLRAHLPAQATARSQTPKQEAEPSGMLRGDRLGSESRSSAKALLKDGSRTTGWPVPSRTRVIRPEQHG